MSSPELRVNAARLKQDFDRLAEIGATPGGGVHRPTFSDAHLQARAWLRERIEASGLEFRVDGAGNHSAFLGCGPQGGPTLLLGSHLDSVPQGGRFDGALGVLAALEVLRTVQESQLSLPYHLEAIDFTDEEGVLVGLLGSSALVGALDEQDLRQPRGGREALLAGLEKTRLTEAGLLACKRPAGELAGYLELHIEQGPRLVQAGMDIGVVSGIVGIGSYRLTFVGQADHAGATPMEDRLDAAQGAAAFIQSLRHLLLSSFPGAVANVGALSLHPGAFNIVPARAVLAMEYRAADLETLAQLEQAVIERAEIDARRHYLDLEVEFLGKHLPQPMSAAVQQAIRRAAEGLGLSSLSLPSGAGHDAQMLARITPAGMIFIPSQGGASHSAREFSRWGDCLNGANVLLHAALTFHEP